MPRLSNAPLFAIKGSMKSGSETETPTEESRMPVRKFIPNQEVHVEGDEPSTKSICVETAQDRCDAPRADGASGVAGVVKSDTRTVTKEGSVMQGSMPMQDERRRD